MRRRHDANATSQRGVMREICQSVHMKQSSEVVIDPLFKPVPFWSWNEQMQVPEIQRQITQIRQGGWGGAFVHARIGLTVPYLGADWFKAVDATMSACQRESLGVWLYDEDTWPSGFSGGSVPARGAEHRMKALIARPVGQIPPQNCMPIGKAIDGLQVYCWTAPLGNPWFYGSCYADLLNPSTVAHFLHDAYDAYHARYASQYGKLISAQFTDEPSPIFRLGLPRGAVPFSPVLIERFASLFSYLPVDQLHKLFVDTPDAHTFRIHYFRTVNHLFEQSFSSQLGKWCDRHQIGLTGHFMSEHSLYDQTLWGTNVMPHYRHQAIPGIDHLARQVDDIVTAKQCHSVINQYGKKRMLSELYGVSGQGLTFADRWWIASQQIGLGVNLLNPHLALYTMAGCRKRDYPPNLFYQQPWWELNRVLDDALSRLCETMSQGTYDADVLVLHPIESATALWRGSTSFSDAQAARQDVWDHQPVDVEVRKQIEAIDADFKQLLTQLVGSQRTFDLGDETILADAASIQRRDDHAVFCVGKMHYRIVILPTMLTIRQTTLSLLQAFIEAGGTVIWNGQPIAVDGRNSQQVQSVLAAAHIVPLPNVCEYLDKAYPPSLELHTAPLVGAKTLLHKRQTDDGPLIYLTNLSRVESDPDARITLAGNWASAERLDPFTGVWHALATRVDQHQTHLSIPLYATQTHCIRFSRTAHLSHVELRLPLQTTPTALVGWSVERLDDNTVTLDTAFWQEDDLPESARALPIIAIHKRLTEIGFRGRLRLRHTFNASQDVVGRPLRVVVEHPDQYTLRVNGHVVEYQGLAHWRDIRWLPVDITQHVQVGLNQIELSVSAFQPADRHSSEPTLRYGTEIESIYLVGDFSVANPTRLIQPFSQRWVSHGLPAIVQSAIASDTPLMIQAPRPLHVGDVTRQGMPFYAGRIRYSTTIPMSSTPRLLRIEKLDAAVAEVALDGQIVGHLVSEPFECELPAGGGVLSLTLYGTLRNLLGPHHHPEGELAAVTPGHFEPKFHEPVADAVRAWDAGTQQPDEWTDDYHLIGFGDLGRITLQDIGV